MAITLSHIGEALLKEMADADPDRFYRECKLERLPGADWEIAMEMELIDYGGRKFDPMSRVDLGIRIGERLVAPVEIKLGKKGLTASRINASLDTLGKSNHTDPRWAGSMLAILDKRFKDVSPNEALKVLVDEVEFELSPKWIIIARRSVLKSWKTQRPEFLQEVTEVCFEDLAEPLGAGPFNDLVKRVVDFDYYRRWLNPGIYE